MLATIVLQYVEWYMEFTPVVKLVCHELAYDK